MTAAPLKALAVWLRALVVTLMVCLVVGTNTAQVRDTMLTAQNEHGLINVMPVEDHRETPVLWAASGQRFGRKPQRQLPPPHAVRSTGRSARYFAPDAAPRAVRAPPHGPRAPPVLA
jgi:hypothetical protein